MERCSAERPDPIRCHLHRFTPAPPSNLFIAIRGDTHDGHSFAAEVVRKGVKGLLLARTRLEDLPWEDWIEEDVACIAVDDTIEALGKLAAYHRNRNSARVVAITGSNGKTTTRQMTALVVSQRFRTLSTRKNFNNNIGLPLTLFELCREHQWAVVELGMNAPGEIASLASICRPNIGVITNVAPAHLEGVGSIEGVMHAKGELLDKIDPGGTAVLNADDPLVSAWPKKRTARSCFSVLRQRPTSGPRRSMPAPGTVGSISCCPETACGSC